MMKRRLGDVIDLHHGVALLNQCNQRRYETVANYEDRYLEVDEEGQ